MSPFRSRQAPRTSTRRVAVLGSTGSVGVQALEVLSDALVADLPMEVVGLAAGGRWEQLVHQATALDVRHVHIADMEGSARARDTARRSHLELELVANVPELLDAVRPDLVLNAVVGFAGLEATLAALDRGIDVALANKESLVAAGALCMATAARTGAKIIPVDSEHSALQQCMAGSERAEIESLVLTASGGPFRGRTRGDLADVTVAQALDHPTWSMGGKISIDSATLMNKGLELIEAMVLFGMPERDIETIVHPDSIVHALVRHRDGSMLAHLGWPDMRVPIAWALHHPVRPAVARVRRLDLAQMPALEFEEADVETFRCLALAREAARTGNGAPCILNAANEVAVASFLADHIGFLEIADVVEGALEALDLPGEPDSLDAAREVDALARVAAIDVLAARTS